MRRPRVKFAVRRQASAATLAVFLPYSRGIRSLVPGVRRAGSPPLSITLTLRQGRAPCGAGAWFSRLSEFSDRSHAIVGRGASTSMSPLGNGPN